MSLFARMADAAPNDFGDVHFNFNYAMISPHSGLCGVLSFQSHQLSFRSPASQPQRFNWRFWVLSFELLSKLLSNDGRVSAWGSSSMFGPLLSHRFSFRSPGRFHGTIEAWRLETHTGPVIAHPIRRLDYLPYSPSRLLASRLLEHVYPFAIWSGSPR